MCFSGSISTTASPGSRLRAPGRLLAASASAAAFALALGVGGLAPSLAHADETAPAATNLDRPLTMRDSSATSSIGIAAEGGITRFEFFDSPSTFYSGVLKLDGELAIGSHFKVFGYFPMTGVKGSGAKEGIAGHGNLTLGAQVHGGSKDVQAAFGLSASKYGDDDAVGLVIYDYDTTLYGSPGTIVRGFGSARVGQPDGFFQFEFDYSTFEGGGHTSSNGEISGEGPDLATFKVGGGFSTGGGPVALAEVGAITFPDSQGSQAIYVAELGLRGRFTDDSRASWGVKASFEYAEGLASGAASFELRTDLPVLAGK
jgi:hypothetical protein